MTPRRHLTFVIAMLALILAACDGGGLEDALDQLPADTGNAESDGGDSEGGDEEPATANETVGPVTATAEPGQAWAEVDGERFEYTAADSLHFTCEVSEDSFQINFQTAEGHDLSMSGSNQNGWSGRLTFKPGGGEIVQYSAVAFRDGSVGLGDGEVSYEGTVERMEDFDPNTATDLDATVAVNCAAAGGDPTAVFGDTTVVVPLSGAQGVDCAVAADGFEVIINRLSSDDKQIQFEGSLAAGSWSGLVSIIDGDDNYLSSLPGDGMGLEIDGTTVTYEGSFTHTSDSDPDLEEEIDGTVSVSCP